MAIHTVTQKYTPGSCRNSRNPMRHPPHREMRLDSPALHAEQSRIPNQTRKEPRFSWWNTRESPRTLSQDEMNTDVTSGMQKSSVHPKATRDEAHFPFIGSIAIPCSTAYSTSGLISFRKLQRFPETPVSIYMNIRFSTATRGKLHAPRIISKWELILFDWRGEPTFHKNLKWSFPSAIGMWEGPCVFCLKWNGLREALTQKKAGFPCSGLNSGTSFISQDEGMSESPVETLEKALGLCLIWTGGMTSLWHIERHTEFNPSGWRCLTLFENG